MANVSIRFNVSGVDDFRKNFRDLVLQFERIKAYAKLERAYLNMLRSTRRNRAEKVRKWHLARLHVRACEMRIEKPNATVRIVSRCVRRGEPVVFIEVEAEAIASGKIGPSTCDRRTLLLGHRSSVAEIDGMPVSIPEGVSKHGMDGSSKT